VIFLFYKMTDSTFFFNLLRFHRRFAMKLQFFLVCLLISPKKIIGQGEKTVERINPLFKQHYSISSHFISRVKTMLSLHTTYNEIFSTKRNILKSTGCIHWEIFKAVENRIKNCWLHNLITRSRDNSTQNITCLA